MKQSLIIIAVVFSILIAGCSKDRAVGRPSSGVAEELFNMGREYYDAGKWSKAIKVFTEFTMSYPFHDKVAEGSFLLAQSYFNNEDYQLAAGEYRRLIRRFSQSEYAEKAELMLAESYLASAPNLALEQKDVERALELFRDFITYRPKSEFIEQARDGVRRCRERLAEKEYRTVELYYKLRKPESAVLYADLLAEEFDGTSWVSEALLIKGKCLFDQLDQPDEAKKVFELVVEKYPKTKAAEEAISYLKKIG